VPRILKVRTRNKGLKKNLTREAEKTNVILYALL
jgi:hypothetical protein